MANPSSHVHNNIEVEAFVRANTYIWWSWKFLRCGGGQTMPDWCLHYLKNCNLNPRLLVGHGFKNDGTVRLLSFELSISCRKIVLPPLVHAINGGKNAWKSTCGVEIAKSLAMSWTLEALKYSRPNTSAIATTKRLTLDGLSLTTLRHYLCIMRNAAVTFWNVLCPRYAMEFLLCSKKVACNFIDSCTWTTPFPSETGDESIAWDIPSTPKNSWESTGCGHQPYPAATSHGRTWTTMLFRGLRRLSGSKKGGACGMWSGVILDKENVGPNLCKSGKRYDCPTRRANITHTLVRTGYLRYTTATHGESDRKSWGTCVTKWYFVAIFVQIIYSL
jgi:hypothetical protein